MKHSYESARDAIIACYKNGGKVLVCGNGGSAADSAHIVGELVKGFLKQRPMPAAWADVLGMPLQMGLPAIDLTAQSALISAVANDLGGDYVYAQQALAYAAKGDVLIGITTSGNAVNVINAARAARLKGATVIAFTGEGGGMLAEYADILLDVPARETYQVQELHLKLYHRLCAEVEAEFFDN
ncbi:MAG: D-sedoheptulose-7-phosphate isomerase [Christensenellales bacterium]|jgi:D-sedoheptulose 7-phosphate isomerase